MPKLTDAQLQALIEAGATDEEILQLANEPAAEEESSGMGVGAALGGAALLGGAYLAKKYGLKQAFETLNNARRQGMLTALAIPKSLTGNLGAGVTESIERGSLDPLKEMLRLPTNVRNAVQAFREGGQYQGQPMSKWAIPGRILGATDEAAQAALVRAGVTPKRAAEVMLQNEVNLGPQVSAALNTPAGQYLVPFRRTPVNQAVGGLQTMFGPGAWSGKGNVINNALALGSGFATGEASDEGAILPTAFGTAAFGRRGLPFAAASMLGKMSKGESNREAAKVMQGTSPVSDYSVIEGIQGPFEGNFGQKPAILRLLGLDK